MSGWSVSSIPDQSGRVAIVTGASSGLGTEVADALARRGAIVILAVRNDAKGEAVRSRILQQTPGANVVVSRVDLADLASIRAFAALEGQRPAIDILVNNAGLGMQPQRAATSDGFERQLGTNHLGPFALTGLLLPALLRASAPRVVAVASIAHRGGKIDFADLQGEARYSGGKAYNQSKLANILFALELDRRARRAGMNLTSVVAHPGISTTGFLDAAQMGAGEDLAAGARCRHGGPALDGVGAAHGRDLRGVGRRCGGLRLQIRARSKWHSDATARPSARPAQKRLFRVSASTSSMSAKPRSRSVACRSFGSNRLTHGSPPAATRVAAAS